MQITIKWMKISTDMYIGVAGQTTNSLNKYRLMTDFNVLFTPRESGNT